MNLVLKKLERAGRSMYLYFPQGEARTPFKRCSITVLRDNDDEASVTQLLLGCGLAKLAEENEIILAFPNPINKRWNYALDPSAPDDLAFFEAAQNGLSSPTEPQRPAMGPGAPDLGMNHAGLAQMLASQAMQNIWHPMNDTKYLIGIGSGASMACTLAAKIPNAIAAVLILGGELTPSVAASASGAPVPAYIVNGGGDIVNYFIQANQADETYSKPDRKVYRSAINPVQCVISQNGCCGLNADIILAAWNDLFKRTRRPNTDPYGDVERRYVPEEDYNFEIYIDDTRLGDQNGMPHTWFTHVPTCAKTNPENKIPLIVFTHGASDNPAEAAEMCKFHELGEKEGFITVYPWGSNKSTWNSDMTDYGPDDIAFEKALIEYMIDNYPVDPTRVYLSGFSNGAAMAQSFALVHPEMIAAICHIDSNWPGMRNGPADVNYNDITPMRIGLELKKDYDWRMPVWYTYGSREPSYPVYDKCTQQWQYDYWKIYNNITVKPTPPQDNPDLSGCGVVGDKYERITPSARHPQHYYDVQRFYTNDPEPKNYYNYVMMHDKGHDVAEMDPTLGWNYVKHFRRNPDGSLSEI